MIHIIDDYNLVLTLLICLIWNLFFYIIAAYCKFDKVTDMAYGTNFIVVVIVNLVLNGTFYMRQIVVSALVCFWAVRLVCYLFMRILAIGSDKRFDLYRERPLLLLRFWVFQLLSIWVIVLPEVILNSKQSDMDFNWRDYLGWCMFLVGFICEIISDHQKFTFRLNPNNNCHWCDVGLWRYSRHPNYFGEILLWYGLFVSCSASFSGPDYLTILGPIYLTLILLFLSGIPKLESSGDEKFWGITEYQEYKRNTSVLIPLPSGIIVSKWLRCLFCCEFPFYTTQPPMQVT